MSGTDSASPLRTMQRGASHATYRPREWSGAARESRVLRLLVGCVLPPGVSRGGGRPSCSGHDVVPAEPKGDLGGGGDQLVDGEVQRLTTQAEAGARDAHRGDDVAVSAPNGRRYGGEPLLELVDCDGVPALAHLG